MNLKEMFLGGWVTALLILVAVCSLGNEPFSAGNFVAVVSVLYAFCCGIRVVLLSTGEKAVDWSVFKWFAIGAGVSAIVPSALFFIAA